MSLSFSGGVFMRLLARGILILSIISGGTSCSVNIMEDFADIDTNEAIYFKAKQLVNEGSYSLALTELANLTGTYPSKEKVILLKASANAGLCGLNFVSLVQGLQNLGSTTFMNFLRSQYNSTTQAQDLTKLNSCVTAESLISGVGATPALRTADQNVFISMVAFMRLGAWLSRVADADDDGTLDPTFEACTSPGPSSVSDADTAQIGTAINVGFDSLFASGVNLGGYTSAQWSTLCTTLGVVSQNFCYTYSAAGITGTELEGVRSVIREATVGLNSCATDSVPGNCATPVCP